MFAAVVVPLFGVFYSPGTPSPRAAFVSVVAGAATRVVLEFALPKDGFLLLPFNEEEFYNYGAPTSSKYPTFYDLPPEEVWDPATEPCEQEQYEDYTGVDSLASFLACLICFVGVTALEHCIKKPLFDFPGLTGYEKEISNDDPFVDQVKAPQHEDETKQFDKSSEEDGVQGQENTQDQQEASA